MKYLVVILLFGVLGATWADEDTVKADKTDDKSQDICFEKLGITDADLSLDFDTYDKVPEKVKCVYKCILEEAGMWSDEGLTYFKGMMRLMNLLLETSETDSGTSKYQAIINCVDTIPSDTDQCEAAYRVSACMEKDES